MAAASLRDAAPDDRLAGSYPFLTMTSVLVAGWLAERLSLDPVADDRTRAAAAYFLSVVVSEALGLAAGSHDAERRSQLMMGSNTRWGASSATKRFAWAYQPSSSPTSRTSTSLPPQASTTDSAVVSGTMPSRFDKTTSSGSSKRPIARQVIRNF